MIEIESTAVIDIALFLGVASCLALLFSTRVRTSRSWSATVTPLASIIGSGFLVVVPLLGRSEGAWAPVAMSGILVVAYGLGAAIRANIRVVEPLLDADDPPRSAVIIEEIASFCLVLAYVVSVTFYLRVLASFILSPWAPVDQRLESLLTTAILAGIGVIGASYGLVALERLEKYSVGAKLSVIAGLLVALLIYVPTHGTMAQIAELETAPLSTWDRIRTLAGMLIIVQGFETSHYLDGAYDRSVRVNTMRRAQLISAFIYLAFVCLSLVLVPRLPAAIDETSILTVSGIVTPILPPLLIFAAVMSQFSAAVADTVGGGGLISSVSERRVPTGRAYLAICLAGILITWTADVFTIIAWASRAFALYYGLQCVQASVHGSAGPRRLIFSVLSGLMFFVVLFAIPST